MDYQLLHEDENSYRLRHPEGHEVVIAKKAVSDAIHKKIQSFYKGGVAKETEAEDEEAANDSSGNPFANLTAGADPVATPVPELNQGQNVPRGTPSPMPTPTPEQMAQISASPTPAPSGHPAPNTGGATGSWDESASQAPGQAAEPGQVPGDQAQGAQPQSPDYIDRLVNEKSSAIKGLANAQSAGAKAQAQAFGDNAKLQEDYSKQVNASRIKLDEEHEALMDAAANGKIDPNRLWNESGTGAKIAAGIGLLLGGIGAGLTRGPNQALVMINHLVDRDIDAQKANLGKTQSLLSANMQAHHNLAAAETATRLQYNSMLQGKLSQVAANTTDAMAQKNADLAITDLKIQAVPLKNQLALTMAKAVSAGAVGGSQGGLPVGQEPAGLLMDKGYAEKRVLVGDRAYQHTGSAKDASEMRTFESKLGPISQGVKRLEDLGPEAVVPGTDAYNAAKSIRAGLATSIAGLKSTEIGSSRINEAEAHQAIEQIKDPTSFKQIFNGGVRNHEFFKDLQETAESLRHENLLGYKGMASVPGRKSGGWKK